MPRCNSQVKKILSGPQNASISSYPKENKFLAWTSAPSSIVSLCVVLSKFFFFFFFFFFFLQCPAAFVRTIVVLCSQFFVVVFTHT
jgi:hypothetical protein